VLPSSVNDFDDDDDAPTPTPSSSHGGDGMVEIRLDDDGSDVEVINNRGAGGREPRTRSFRRIGEALRDWEEMRRSVSPRSPNLVRRFQHQHADHVTSTPNRYDHSHP
jgi:hypothetical protein